MAGERTRLRQTLELLVVLVPLSPATLLPVMLSPPLETSTWMLPRHPAADAWGWVCVRRTAVHAHASGMRMMQARVAMGRRAWSLGARRCCWCPYCAGTRCARGCGGARPQPCRGAHTRRYPLRAVFLMRLHVPRHCFGWWRRTCPLQTARPPWGRKRDGRVVTFGVDRHA